MNPVFHMYEIDDGEGRSVSEELTVFISGWFFFICFFISILIVLVV